MGAEVVMRRKLCLKSVGKWGAPDSPSFIKRNKSQ